MGPVDFGPVLTGPLLVLQGPLKAPDEQGNLFPSWEWGHDLASRGISHSCSCWGLVPPPPTVPPCQEFQLRPHCSWQAFCFTAEEFLFQVILTASGNPSPPPRPQGHSTGSPPQADDLASRPQWKQKPGSVGTGVVSGNFYLNHDIQTPLRRRNT